MFLIPYLLVVESIDGLLRHLAFFRYGHSGNKALEIALSGPLYLVLGRKRLLRPGDLLVPDRALVIHVLQRERDNVLLLDVVLVEPLFLIEDPLVVLLSEHFVPKNRFQVECLLMPRQMPAFRRQCPVLLECFHLLY